MSPQENLAMTAATLARAAPDQWRQFLAALAVHNEMHRDNLINSPIPELPVNQGRAQHSSTLLAELQKCQAIADKINARKALK